MSAHGLIFLQVYMCTGKLTRASFDDDVTVLKWGTVLRKKRVVNKIMLDYLSIWLDLI